MYSRYGVQSAEYLPSALCMAIVIDSLNYINSEGGFRVWRLDVLVKADSNNMIRRWCLCELTNAGI